MIEIAFYPEYISLDDLKRHLRIPGNYDGTLNSAEDDVDNIPLNLAISTASRAIDTSTSRQFGLMDSAHSMYYTPYFDSKRQRYAVAMDDLMTTSGFVVKYDSTGNGDYTETVDSSDYRLWPYNAAEKGKPWTHIMFDVGTSVPLREAAIEATGRFGWSAVPDAIKQATLLQAARFFKRRDSAFGVAGSPENGSELRLLNRVDPDVEVAVRDYRRWWGAK